MIIKSYIVEQDVSVLNKFKAFLFYGVNDGVKDDVKHQLKQINKNQEIIIFFENEILKNRNILYENIINESLFSEKKIIFIQFATDKILNEIIESLEKKSVDTKIVIIADNLDRKSKLRTLFEKEKKLAVFACYQDNDRSLIDYINKELAGYKGVTGELVNMMISNSGYNRKIIQNELLKIKNFFLEKIIKKNQLLEILNIKNDIGFDEIRDNALIGRKNKINKLLSETSILNEESFFYINNLNYRVLKLIEIKKMNEVFNSYEQTLEKIKPPIFWKDKSIYLEQLKKWNLEKLNRAADKIGETEVLIRKNSHIKKDIIIKNLIIALSDEASTSS